MVDMIQENMWLKSLYFTLYFRFAEANCDTLRKAHPVLNSD